MDSFDDFEMKPLTEGLGFHKKKVDLRESVKKSKVSDSELGSSLPTQPPRDFLDDVKENSEIEDLMSALDDVSSRIKGRIEDLPEPKRTPQLDDEVEIINPLPRKKQASSFETFQPDPVMPNFEIEETDFKQPEQERPAIRINSVTDAPPVQKPVLGTKRGAADSPPVRLSPAPFSISSALLDAMVVLALALLFLVSLLTVTGVNLNSVFTGMQGDLMTQLSIGLLYLAVYQMYMVVSRSFFGRSLGEWTFDYQLGDDKQITAAYYPFLVLWRSLLTVMTGVVFLPILSVIVRKDVASYLTGLQLYKRN